LYQAQKIVIALHNKAQSQEHQSAQEECKTILEKAKALQSPKSDSQAAWREWTSQVFPKEKNRVQSMATYGRKNRSLVEQQVAQTWNKQIEALENRIQELSHNKSSQDLKALEQAYETNQQEIGTCQKAKDHLEEEKENILQQQREENTKLETLKKELNELEHRVGAISIGTTTQQREEKRRAIVKSTATLEQLCNTLESFQNNYISQTAALETELSQRQLHAADLLDRYEHLHTDYTRELERATNRLQAAHQARELFWPELLLSLGEVTSSSQAKLSSQEIEEERARKAAIAAMKDCFAKAKAEWSELEQAMEKYTQDHENLGPLLEQMGRAADATEEICNNSAHSSSDDITAAGTAVTKTARATRNLILILKENRNTPSQTALEIIKQAAQQTRDSNLAQNSPFHEEIAWATQATLQIADWAHQGAASLPSKEAQNIPLSSPVTKGTSFLHDDRDAIHSDSKISASQERDLASHSNDAHQEEMIKEIIAKQLSLLQESLLLNQEKGFHQIKELHNQERQSLLEKEAQLLIKEKALEEKHIELETREKNLRQEQIAWHTSHQSTDIVEQDLPVRERSLAQQKEHWRTEDQQLSQEEEKREEQLEQLETKQETLEEVEELFQEQSLARQPSHHAQLPSHQTPPLEKLSTQERQLLEEREHLDRKAKIEAERELALRQKQVKQGKEVVLQKKEILKKRNNRFQQSAKALDEELEGLEDSLLYDKACEAFEMEKAALREKNKTISTKKEQVERDNELLSEKEKAEAKKQQDRQSRSAAAKSFDYITNYLNHAATSLTYASSSRAAGDEETASLHTKAATAYQAASDNIAKAGKAHLSSHEVQHRNVTLNSFQKSAAAYEQAAHYYTEAAKENKEGERLSKKTIVDLLHQAGELQHQIAQTIESNELTSSLEESLQQLKKQIDHFFGTRGAQVEEQAEALLRGDKKVAWLHKKRAEALGGNGAAYVYERAADAEAEGKPELAALWRASAKNYEEQARAYQEQAEALLREDEKAAEHHEKRAKALNVAAEAYENAAKAEVEGKSEVAAAWRASAKAHEEQAEALLRGDEKRAWLHEQRAGALGGNYWGEGGAANAYENAAKAEAEGKLEIAALRRASAKAREEQADALLRGDEKVTEHHEKRAKALNVAAEVYENAAKAEAEGKSEIAALRRASAKASQEEAEALFREDKKGAELHQKRVTALSRAPTAYERSADAEAKGKSEIASLWRASAKAFEEETRAYQEQAEALLRGDETAAALHRKRAEELRSQAAAKDK
jgi:hypothetical protein